jgi:tRNA G10  N-methylase Trm11
MEYVFLFGRTPALSAAELSALFAAERIVVRTLQWGPQWAIAEFGAEQEIRALQRRLAGIVKIGRILARGKDPETLLSTDLLYERVPVAPRMTFGFSGYPEHGAFGARLRRIGLARKKALSAAGYSARFVTSKDEALSSAAVKKNGLLDDGREFCVFRSGVEYAVAETLTVQPFEEAAARDRRRTGLDARSGMLPPRIARMMVNLAQVKPGGTLLDPFCGSGTVLTEARDLGLAVIGSDKSEKAVRDSEKNLQQQESTASWRILHRDIAALTNDLAGQNVDAIVTEPYLGPPQRRTLTAKDAEALFRSLRGLYKSAFAAFEKLLVPGGRLVFLLPAVQDRGRLTLYPEIRELVADTLLHVIDPLPKDAYAAYGGELTARKTLLYARPRQTIVREVLVYKKKEGQLTQ